MNNQSATSSPYTARAEPHKYRVADKTLFGCCTHGAAAVLCCTAGKSGRNGRTATVGATLFWLTCPYLNHLIARLEQHGAVQCVACTLHTSPMAMQLHCESHTVFLERVRDLLSCEQFSFFSTHFSAPADETRRKYGNAAVSHAEDMKCLHALVAQSLCGARNLVGLAVANYVVLLHTLLERLRGDGVCEDVMRRTLDSMSLFKSYLAAALEGDRHFDNDVLHLDVALETTGGTAAVLADGANVCSNQVYHCQYMWRELETLRELSPDLCQRAYEVLCFVQGKPPQTRHKHRRN